MSYILNALRKSERERQAIQPDTVTSRIIAYDAPRHQSSARLIAALIIANLAVLIYFLGFSGKNADEESAPVAKQSIAPVSKPLEAEPAEREATSRPVARKFEAKFPPIAKIVAARSEPPATSSADKPAVVKKQPIEPVMPRPVPQQPVAQPAEPEEPAEDDVNIPVAMPTLVPVAVPAPLPANPPAPAPLTAPVPAPQQTKNDFPLLDDLPIEFRRSLPDLPINVFSYSSTPAERFIMVDMVKYVPGQRIKDQLELKEIRPDSIVVSYEERTFIIKRP